MRTMQAGLLVIATMTLAAFGVETRAQTTFADLSHPLATGWHTFRQGFLATPTTVPTVNHDLTITLGDGSQVTFRAQSDADVAQLLSFAFVRVFFELLVGSPATRGTLTALRSDFSPYDSRTFSDELFAFYSGDTIYEDFSSFEESTSLTPFEPAHYLYTNSAGADFLLMGDGSGHFTTLIPEPGTYALLLAGLGLLGFAARPKNRRLP